jgi:hypothetical protein
MYLARSFPLIKPASFHLPTGHEPFDASSTAPPTVAEYWLPWIPTTVGSPHSAAKLSQTKIAGTVLPPRPDAFADITPRTNILGQRPSKKNIDTIYITSGKNSRREEHSREHSAARNEVQQRRRTLASYMLKQQ